MRQWLALVVAATLVGCGQKPREAAEAAVDTTPRSTQMPMGGAMPMDSGMMSDGMHMMMMDSAMMVDSAGGMRGGRMMSAMKDADQMFLRMMSDHHEGLIRMSTQAMERGGSQAVKDDAHRLHTRQMAERDSMVAMLKQHYAEDHQPMPMRMNMMQADSLSRVTGADHDRMYYRAVIAHHQQAVAMIDHLLPRMQRPEVRQMAERMKADQQREIQELQQKLNQA